MRASTTAPRACSGAMYRAVPMIVWVSVSGVAVSVRARAIPKSMTLMREGRPRDSSSSSRSSTMTLAGLMSRWITPCSWL